MSKYDKWIEYNLKRRERHRAKDRADGLREYLAYRAAKNAPPEPEVKKPAKAGRPKRNQPDDWSFLDE